MNIKKSFATTISRDGYLDMVCPKCKSHNVSIIHSSNLSSRIAKIVCDGCGYTLLPAGITPPLPGQIVIDEILGGQG